MASRRKSGTSNERGEAHLDVPSNRGDLPAESLPHGNGAQPIADGPSVAGTSRGRKRGTSAPTVVATVVTTEPEPAPAKPNVRKPRARKPKASAPAPVLVETAPALPLIAPALAVEVAGSVSLEEVNRELRQAKERAEEVQGELATARKQMEGAGRELEAIQSRSVAMKKELADAESALPELRRTLQECRALREQLAPTRKEIEGTAQELEAIKAGSLAAKKELADAESALPELRAAREQGQGLRDQIGAARKEVQAAAQELEAIKARALAAKEELANAEASLEGAPQAVEHWQSVRAQLGAAEEELQQTTRGLEAIKERSQAARDELAGAEALLPEARRALEQCQKLREQVGVARQELQHTAQELEAIKARSVAVNGEIAETAGSLRDGQQALATTGDDLQAQAREGRARLLAIQQDCQDLERASRQARSELEMLRSQLQEAGAEVEAARVRELPRPEEVSAIPEPVTALAPATAIPPAAPPAEGPREEAPAPQGKNRLGVTVDRTAAIVDVLPDTPAEKAGLRVGDVIVAAEGKPIASSEDLRVAIDHLEDGKEVHLTVVRGEERQEIAARLPGGEPEGATAPAPLPPAEPAESAKTEAPAPEAKKELGVTVDTAAVIVDVLPGTPADKAGLHSGDAVIEVNGKPISTSEDLRVALDKADTGKDVLVTVARPEEPKAPSAPLEAAVPEGQTQLGVAVDGTASVVHVFPETPAARAGLQAGDQVVAVDGKPIASSEDLRAAMQQAEPGHDVLVTVSRSDETEQEKAALPPPQRSARSRRARPGKSDLNRPAQS